MPDGNRKNDGSVSSSTASADSVSRGVRGPSTVRRLIGVSTLVPWSVVLNEAFTSTANRASASTNGARSAG